MVVDDAGKLRIEHGKHIRAVFPVQGKQYLAVTVTAEAVALCCKLAAEFSESVYLAVADNIVPVKLKGLHPLWSKSHYRKALKSQNAVFKVDYPLIVRTS